MTYGFVICSRLHSSRLFNKAVRKYSGKTHIELLVKRLLPYGRVYVAIPSREMADYSFLLDLFPKNVFLYGGNEDDPMARMYDCAVANKLDRVIRVTHDKLFINVDAIEPMLKESIDKNLDYVYSSNFVAGTGFEILSKSVLEKATRKFSRVEHVSYAIKAITKNSVNFKLTTASHKDIRLLVDYPEDAALVDILISCLGHDCTLKEVLTFIVKNNFLKKVNALPEVTIYTCALNASKWIDEAMESVAKQNIFPKAEYILIDDHSTDKTLFHMARFCQKYPNAKFIRNGNNIGLSSSSNLAMKHARGKYIVRLDADDFFTSDYAIFNMIGKMETDGLDIVYPNCYSGLSMKYVQEGKDEHHVGGTLFRTSALNMIKFTDSLMHHDSLDIFLRSQDILKYGYYKRPVFCYRQHNKSMSKNDLGKRKKIKKILLDKYKKEKSDSTLRP